MKEVVHFESSPGGKNCPPEIEWDQFATGLIAGGQAERMLEHTSSCADCALILKGALHVFMPDAIVTEFPQPRSKNNWIRYWPAAAAMFAIAISSAGWWLLKSPSDARMQLAQLSARERAFSMRFPAAPFGPFQPARGPVSAASADRLQIAAEIARDLKKHPNDAGLLAAQGRLHLMNQDPDSALIALKAADDLGAPEDLAMDTGIAYWLRGMRSKNAADLQMAVEVLSAYIQKYPKDAAARFNRAIVEEDLLQLIPAIEDLEKAIALEQSPAWKQEAEERLAKLKLRKGVLFDRPAGADSKRFAEVALEDAMKAGLWLGKPDAELNQSASRMANEHQDSWLQATLRLPRSPLVNEAVRTLARAAGIRQASAIGLYAAEDRAMSRLASVSLPTELLWWRELEENYRATHTREAYGCASAGRPAPENFPWLAAQILRERGSCAFIATKQQTLGMALVEDSLRIGSAHRLLVSEQRSSGVMGAFESRQGRVRESLNRMWQNAAQAEERRVPIQRLHEPFNLMMLGSERIHRLHAARRAAMMSTFVAEAAGFPNLTFTSRAHWGELAIKTGDEEAEQIYRKAVSMPGNVTTPGWRAWAQMGLADATNNAPLLIPFEKELVASKDPRLQIPYRIVTAKFAEKMGELDWAQQGLQALVDSTDPFAWRDELARANQMLLSILLKRGNHEAAFQRLQGWRGGKVHRGPFLMFALEKIGDRIAVWRQSESTLDFQWAPNNFVACDRLRRRLLRVASSPDGSTTDVNQTARELATGLFGSWLTQLDGTLPVIFQTSAEFGDLPFGLLPARQQPLAFELVWAETHHAMDGFASKPIRTAVAVDAMAAPIPAGFALPLLPSASQELKAVSAAGWATLSLSGSAVNPSSLAAAMERADLLHFAGHAIPRNNGAALLVEKGADGNAMFEVAKWPGKTPALVVLSACGTARSSRDEVDTLTPAGLARAFLEKGTRQVIASYWEVDSNASVKFMQRFYGSLAVQGDSGRAMRDAMQTMKSDHPYYWGVYTRLIRG